MAPHATKSEIEIEGSSTSNTEGSAILHTFLARYSGISFLRCQWQDYSGVVRARVVPIEHAISIAAGKRRLHVPPFAFQIAVTNDIIPEASPSGNHWLIPDWTSLYTSQLELASRSASVMCGVVEDLPTRPEANWNYCPRHALKTVVKKAEELLHVYFLVGCEVEFQIMKLSADGKLGPHSAGLGRYAISGLRDPCFAHVQEVVRLLLDAGVGISAFQTEGGRGQFEIALEPQSPIRAVDQLILVQDTLKSVFARHGLVATMAPRPVVSDKQTAGQHTHISLNPPNNEATFLAGILHRLPELCAFSLPYDLSYERIQPCLAGHFVAWGSENRAVPIRQIKPGHWELRCVDATANMYLALAAIISAGTIGCINEEPLQWPDTSLIANSFSATDTETLPESIGAALERLEKSCDSLQDIMESQVIRHYISAKRFEAPKLRNMSLEATRQMLNEIF
ncbi:hypothetical protein FQN49_004546 [Arthroderma sp. PD_2]|nr:hypothetical protein FQN49_004546 [Arthroderma sp. PD_2]